MCDAFRLAKSLLEDWGKEHPESYPPKIKISRL